VLEYCRLSNREYEYIALTRDSTESDLKQRREIKDASAIWVDRGVVSAAIHGRILIIEGIERAERNVLPVLNNLLENREMGLEDGRFIVSHERYGGIIGDRAGIVRCHPGFLVIAIGLFHVCLRLEIPVPLFHGFSLDPPLRSRFQARNISIPSIATLQRLLLTPGDVKMETFISIGLLLANHNDDGLQGKATVPQFAVCNLDGIKNILRNFPDIGTRCLLAAYPYLLL
jgi:hypothetical protein